MKKMRLKSRYMLGVMAFALCTGGALAQNQNNAQENKPESLLPPGFQQPGQGAPATSPAPAPTPAPANVPPPSSPPKAPAQNNDGGNAANPGNAAGAAVNSSNAPAANNAPPPVPTSNNIGQISSDAAARAETEELENALENNLDAQLAQRQSLPPDERRDLKNVGLINHDNGGLADDAMGRSGGQYSLALLNNIKAPLVSRWGVILLRRTLVSTLQTPSDVSGASWVAARSALLTRVGDADAGRRLIQKIDPPNFNRAAFEDAMHIYLAAADPAGMCQIMPFAPNDLEGANWIMIRAICAALSGEQGAATAQIDRAGRNKIAKEIDILLGEKTIGAGANGRRKVTIEWDAVDELTPWRFGLALATGVEPPMRLYENAGRIYQAWRSTAPMVSIDSRAQAADISAAMGILSARNMNDLYSEIYDSVDASSDLRTKAEVLRSAWLQNEDSKKLDALKKIWTGNNNSFVNYSDHILTAYAAAQLPVNGNHAGSADDLINSMLTAGLDHSAMRWRPYVGIGSTGWAQLVLADPKGKEQVAPDDLKTFFDLDYSEDHHQTALFVAGLTALGRISNDDSVSALRDLGISLGRKSRWTQAIMAAARRKDKAMVVFLSAAGMQGSDWSKMTPLHLFHIVAALNTVGFNAEARMIAAEAIVRSA